MIRLSFIAVTVLLASCVHLTATSEDIARSQLEEACEKFRAEAKAIDSTIEAAEPDTLTKDTVTFMKTAGEATALCEQIKVTTSPGQDSLDVQAKTREIQALEIIR